MTVKYEGKLNKDGMKKYITRNKVWKRMKRETYSVKQKS